MVLWCFFAVFFGLVCGGFRCVFFCGDLGRSGGQRGGGGGDEKGRESDVCFASGTINSMFISYQVQCIDWCKVGLRRGTKHLGGEGGAENRKCFGLSVVVVNLVCFTAVVDGLNTTAVQDKYE